VVGEQAPLKRSRTPLPRGVIRQPQGLQPSAFAEDLKPEEPRLDQRDRRPEKHRTDDPLGFPVVAENSTA
jgi:hypothetical protein